MHMCDLHAGEEGDNGKTSQISQIHWPASLDEFMSSRTSQRPCMKKKAKNNNNKMYFQIKVLNYMTNGSIFCEISS